MRVAIHQPNFFPWAGIFHRIARVDKFIFFDHVQAVRGKSWLSRNKILLNSEPRWLTIPTRKSGRSFQRVSDVLINYDNNVIRKHLGTLTQAYGKCEHFEEIYRMVSDLYDNSYVYLSDFNKEFIQIVSSKLHLGTTFVSSSELILVDERLDRMRGNELVLHLCLVVGANQYISGTGCLDFIDTPEFERNGVDFNFQQFFHPEYPQINTESFVSHLSSLDVMFNIGFEGLRKVIS